MCDDIQKHGQTAKRVQGGIHHRYAGKYAGHLNAQKELGTAAEVIDTKTKKAAAKFKGWTMKELKLKCLDLQNEKEDLHNQVYHSVCIVSVGLSKSGVSV
jgi:hypothetical protein